MKSIQKTLALLIALALCLSLAACGSDGDTISAYEFVIDDTEALPSPADPLTQSIAMEDSPIPLEIYYPETMEGHAQDGIARRLSFNAINGAGTDEEHTNINFNMVNIGTSYDSYMGKGFNSAKSGMQKILDGILAQYYPNGELLKSIGTDFTDGGTYYDITGYLWLDGSAFLAPASQPVRATCTVRYVGPVGYVLVAVALAVEPRIQTYYEICQKMLKAIDFGGDWSTAPKAVSGGGSGGAWSDNGDYGTAYYWTDSDGDIWYWNGYEDVFIGYWTGDNGNYMQIDPDGYWEYRDDTLGEHETGTLELYEGEIMAYISSGDEYADISITGEGALDVSFCADYLWPGEAPDDAPTDDLPYPYLAGTWYVNGDTNGDYYLIDGTDTWQYYVIDTDGAAYLTDYGTHAPIGDSTDRFDAVSDTDGSAYIINQYDSSTIYFESGNDAKELILAE